MQASPELTTLLFTDIEGSTRLWEQDGERMSRALAVHDALSRKAVEQHGGVVVKMTGDGMYAAFADALAALQATTALQQSLEALAADNRVALRVRAGLHTGVVERRDQDLFGSPVNRAARIMKAAHGGQVLLSQSVADQVRDRLPARISLRDLGAVRLRDLATSEHVYQLLHPALRADFPALRSLEATPNNLPQQVTSFVGRGRELAEAKRLLESTRLLTLLGMGGLGKTRLALQIGADALDKYPDGVWFVDFAPIRDESLVINAAAQVLGIREEPGKPLAQTLCAHLADRELLLVLDNCEHLIGACARLADALLAGTREVRILATTREALHIRGEQTYAVLPLAVPDRKADTEALLRSEAVQLFVERARLQKPAFAVTERDAPAVAELCARLEGIPLALELAAARLRSLSLADINARLHDRFKLLTTGSRAALERQQTLRALVSWSYDLLQRNEQIVLDRLSVFCGGFDLEAAEAVCGADPIASDDVLDLVTSLVDKSLVMVEQEGQGSRYGLLETIREFAHEHLAQRWDMQGTIREIASEHLKARDDVAATSSRHCHYYLGIAKMARDKLQGPEQAEWTRRIEVDLDNCRAAIALALAGGVDPVIAVKFEAALMQFRTLRGYVNEGRNNIRTALALAELREPGVARGYALYVGGALAARQSDHADAETMLTECLEVRRALHDRLETAGTLSTLAQLHVQMGDTAKAREYQAESLAIFREVGNAFGEALGVANLGEISLREGDHAGARSLFEQCLAIARRIEHQEIESECERNLGELALGQGDLAEAHARFVRSLSISRQAEDKRGEAITLWALGRADSARGDFAAAREKFSASMRSLQAFEMTFELLDCLEDHARLLQLVGQSANAVHAFAAAATFREAFRLTRPPYREADKRASLEAARAALGGAAFDAAWSIGQRWALEEAVEHALDTDIVPLAA